eukprot:tig00021582_g22612.t1
MGTYFTPQQEMGYSPFHHRVRVGNWSEDMELAQAKLKDYLMRKERGELAISAAEARFAHALQPVELSAAPEDGYLRYGAVVMLYNFHTQAHLATDINDKLPSDGQTDLFAATTTLYNQPCARNSFAVLPAKDGKVGDVVRYGQKVQIVTLPPFSSDKFFLHSLPVSPFHQSKVSRNQEVSFAKYSGENPRPSYNCSWEIQSVDPSVRLELEGTPVPLGAAVMINHCLTQRAFASDLYIHRNEFGGECETFCKSFLDPRKQEHGRRERTLPGPQNHWSFVSQPPSAPPADS